MPPCRRAVFATIASASSTPRKWWRCRTSRSSRCARKRDSSIARAAELVGEGKADALVSLGNTGGIFAAATFKVGRIPGVDRGCIATVMPRQESEFVLLDAGANVECKPVHLAQFAVMGSVYSREVLKHKKPRVGVLSIGTEDTKGNELTLEAFRLCKKLDLNFIGNVEGHDLFKDHVDVVVCDGFVGNVVLKSVESLAVAMFSMLKRELMHTTQRQLGAYLAKGAFQAIRRRMDPEVYGGAPMLGFNGVVFKAHASARERAVTSAIRMTANAAAKPDQPDHRPRHRGGQQNSRSSKPAVPPTHEESARQT